MSATASAWPKQAGRLIPISSAGAVSSGAFLAGYNYMITPRALLGIEGDFTWSDVTYSALAADGSGNVFNLSLKQKDAYSVRARFGYLLAPETLLYGTAG